MRELTERELTIEENAKEMLEEQMKLLSKRSKRKFVPAKYLCRMTEQMLAVHRCIHRSY